MTDILDALDAINGAEALVKEWEREFLREWYRPLRTSAAKAAARRYGMGVGSNANARIDNVSKLKKTKAMNNRGGL